VIPKVHFRSKYWSHATSVFLLGCRRADAGEPLSQFSESNPEITTIVFDSAILRTSALPPKAGALSLAHTANANGQKGRTVFVKKFTGEV
jgi:hypothetical protein